ncbi:SGNH/GDSL hydrolase family protein [Tundrisphaera sp. TA3]|uniref:SGNH/GDSL hydrolase family protein n=1 Tax=Tundrisphaera sp. TA3 TaxID=3435775 RepID=UPI003EBBDC63
MRIPARPHRLAAVLAVLLLLSVVGNVALAWAARAQYRKNLQVRLDPTSEIMFLPLNSALPPAPGGVHRVVFLGDSRTEMWRDLPDLDGCQRVNRGRSNDTSAQLLLRVERDAIALKPDLVFLEVGANDLKSIGLFPDDEASIRGRFRANVFAIIDRLARAGIPVVVSTVFPFGDVSLLRRPIWSDRIVAARDEWNREIRALHRPGVTVFDADAVLSSDGRMKPQYQLDELHLNDAAYRALNAALPAVIRRSLDDRPR